MQGVVLSYLSPEWSTLHKVTGPFSELARVHGMARVHLIVNTRADSCYRSMAAYSCLIKHDTTTSGCISFWLGGRGKK